MIKKNDLVIMTEYGILKLINKNNPHYKKLKLTIFKVTDLYNGLNEVKVDVERMNGNPLGSFPIEYFKLANQMEIKLFTLYKIFN